MPHDEGYGCRVSRARRIFTRPAHRLASPRCAETHSLETSTAKLHDSQVWDKVLHGEETSVWADKGYVSAEREAAFQGPGKVWGVMRKAPKGSPLHPVDAQIKRIIAMVRAKVEHPFRVIKRQFRHVKTRYRGWRRTALSSSASSHPATCSWSGES